MIYNNPLKKVEKVKIHHFLKHVTKRHVALKFILLIIVLLVYTMFLAWQYGWKDGGILSIITWSFFVLCTPVADAGFLLDFPLRLIFKIRMILSEGIVWGIAILINVLFLIKNPNVYDYFLITHVFKKILLNPYPYWGVILLSGLGTFLSVQFGDELLDLVHHKHRSFHHKHSFKLELIVIFFLFIMVFIFYSVLLERLGIEISM